jgi:protease-4
MSKGAKVALVLIVLLIVILGVALVAGALVFGKGKIPDKTILEADFEQQLVEYVPPDPIAQVLYEKTPTTLGIVEALEKAAEDDRVTALVARVGNPPLGVAQLQELREAVLAFRESGKPAVAYADTFGEFSPGNGGYYLATAFDEIYLQPSGDVGLNGLLLETPFFRGTLDKLDLVPRMDHRYEYKNAMNTFTETELTEPHREALEAIMDSIFGQMVSAIAEARGLSEEEVRSLADRGPFLGTEAVDAGLVDGVAYRDEVYSRLRERAGGEDAQLLYLDRYRDRAGSPYGEGDTVALIYGVGGVARGESSSDPWSGSVMGSDSVAQAFRDAVDDDDVKAILFRVDSPGGSYVASDTIWHETVRAREAGKPVVVSMGNVAGSGGYFVAMAADRIVAQPGTITGSIGVLGGKILSTGLWNRLGVTFGDVHTGEASTMFSSLHDYTPEQWEKFESWLDRVYEDFTSKVAEGRNLPKDRVLQIAKGRVWSGEDALDLGLIDALGGFAEALGQVREVAGLEADAPLQLKLYPRPKTAFEALTDKGRDSSEPVALLRQTLVRLEPALRLARRLGILDSPRGVLTAPEVEVAH